MSAPLEKPEVEAIEDGLRYTWKETAVQVELVRFTDRRGSDPQLKAEATIARTLAGQDPFLLFYGDLNLGSITIRKQIITYLGSRQSSQDVPWDKLLEVLCFMATRRYRKGTPAVHQEDIPEESRPRFALKPYVDYGRAGVLFGPGGSTKTYAAIAAAVSWATGLPIFGEPMGEPMPVLFIDTDTDPRVWKRRLAAVCRGHGVEGKVDVFYRRLFGRFTESASAIRAEARRLGIGYMVYDHLAGLVGGQLVDPTFIVPCFDEIDRFELPGLVVTHVNAEEVKHEHNGRLTPYGTIYTENKAGHCWSIRNRAEEDAPVADIYLRHEKVNEGRKELAHTYQVKFTNAPDNPDHTWSVEYERGQRISEAFKDKRSVSDRIMDALTRGPKFLKDVAEQEQLDFDQVKARARELEAKKKIIQLDDKRYAKQETHRTGSDG